MHVSYPENPVTIGEHIRKKRLELRLFQTDVAKIFNVSEDCITYWENHRSEPQINYYPRIVEFLGYLPFEIDTSTLMGKLKAYRFMHGLSVKRFAKMMNVDPSTVRLWEDGKISATKIKILSQFMATNQVCHYGAELTLENGKKSNAFI